LLTVDGNQDNVLNELAGWIGAIMKVTIEVIEPAGEATRTVRALVVESKSHKSDVPVLLFLHGKGEASTHENHISHVCDHFSPPLQTILGHLEDVTVVAPQAPYDPAEGKEPYWNWRGHLNQLETFLSSRFSGGTIHATGFSLGGLGVLQLLCAHPTLITRWAIVDPQPPDAGEQRETILRNSTALSQGWLRYGRQFPAIEQFSKALAEPMRPQHVAFVDLKHSELAVQAYNGSNLEEKGKKDVTAQSLYEFLELTYHH
jgi:pimeloyl-ACP methyl ester carboxylesterase